VNKIFIFEKIYIFFSIKAIFFKGAEVLNITLTKKIDDNQNDFVFDIGQLEVNPPKLYDVMIKINEIEPNSGFNSTIKNNTIMSLGGKEERDGMSWYVYLKEDNKEKDLNKGK
jgi:hypothetical protein